MTIDDIPLSIINKDVFLPDNEVDAKTEAMLEEHDRKVAAGLVRAEDIEEILSKVDDHLRDYNEANKHYLKSTIVDVMENVFGKEESTYIVKNRVPLLCQSVIQMKGDISDIKLMMTDQYRKLVTKEEYAPVKIIVYGIVGTVLSSFMAGLVYLVFKSH